MKKFIKYIAVIIFVFILDFISKAGLLSFLAAKYGNVVYDPNVICAKCHYEGIYINWRYLIGGDYGLSNLFNIQFVWNKGVSFSALNSVMPWLLCIGTAFVIGFIFYYLFKKSAVYERLPLAMILGGALGNLFDRIRFGAVADFIQWHIGNLWTFPAIFNVADMFITFGIILWFINMLINKRYLDK